MHRSHRFAGLALLSVLAAALACNMPGATPAPDLAQMVAQTQTAMAVLPGETRLPPGVASSTPGAVMTPGAGVTAAPPAGAPTTAPLQPGAVSPTSAPPTAGLACTDKARFINETIPDNTPVPPGASFMKTWTLQNVGTCTWTREYSLVLSEGEQMGGTSPQPIGSVVAPNSTLQIYLPQTAPAGPGAHQGFWMLKNAAGQTFGLGEDGRKAFWVKINVTPGAPAPDVPGSAFPTAAPGTQPTLAPAAGQNLGPATRTWTFSGKQAPFYLGDDEDVGFTVDAGALLLTAFEPVGDQWRVAEQSYVDNFALEARFTTGPQCAGKDDYGLLARAPSQPDNIVDSGYVFGFNCNGQFRVYRMDNGGYSGLVQWTNHPAVKPGPNQTNVMTVVGQGEQFQLYANGTLLFQLSDSTYRGGLFGLMVGAAGPQDFKVAVSQIDWWKLP